ncbi:hypothetical protein BTW15_17805 [Pseudomonas syringae pv. tomato]|uniref:Uncharacterized protein n=1 Tax=Pseudomonas syringae pv. tomato TaxID=323 RepID=A0AB36KU50_PSEUB|nr:hypothetical protein BTW15_17805 [Pseudomonas syringae pv. tomato]
MVTGDAIMLGLVQEFRASAALLALHATMNASLLPLGKTRRYVTADEGLNVRSDWAPIIHSPPFFHSP